RPRAPPSSARGPSPTSSPPPRDRASRTATLVIGVRSADNNGRTMYDALRSRYTFACPTRGQSHVTLSAFRELVRLDGATHPAVYQVRFACPCGDDHVGFVTHAELDWAPLGPAGGPVPD